MLDHPRLQALINSVKEFFRQKILGLFAPHESKIQEFKQQVTEGATTLDRDLTELYPDRYPAIKQKVGEAKSWYDEQIAEQKANPDRPFAVDQNYQQIAQRMEEFGQKVASTEKEVKAKIASQLPANKPKS
jgi:hypothetical protein